MLTTVDSKVATTVVKLGGALLDDHEACATVLDAIASCQRHAPGSLLVVHGGGRAVDQRLTALGHAIERHEGLRITPAEQVVEVASVLHGIVNADLCGRLNQRGTNAIGLRLSDGDSVTIVRQTAAGVDLGNVGTTDGGDGRLLLDLCALGQLPVISSVGHDERGSLMNVNADDAAAGVARAVHAERLILLTDVDGVLDSDGTLIESLTPDEAESLIDAGVVHGGMIAKLRNAVRTATTARTPVVIASWKSTNLTSLFESGTLDAGLGTLILGANGAASTGTSSMSQSTIETKPTSSLPKDMLSLKHWAAADLDAMLALAHHIKDNPGAYAGALKNITVAMLFEKPSLRTRVSFESGIHRLGGHAIYLDHKDERIGVREPTIDYGKNLERWTEVIVARTFSHDTLAELATSTRIPVINALSDAFHPCQALADILTISEHCGGVRGVPVAYLGDGNNVCHSLMLAAAQYGVDLRVITPPALAPDAAVMAEAQAIASDAGTGGSITVTDDVDAVAECQAIYTDTWVSMGQSDSDGAKHLALTSYQVNEALMARAASDAIFMHCLPAHREEEVTSSVIDGPQSVVYDQAENRMHAQNALLVTLVNSQLIHAAPDETGASTIAEGTV